MLQSLYNFISTLASIDFRRDSLDSSSGSDLNAEDSSSESFLLLPTTGKNNGIYHGIGTVAKIVSTKSGILWWIRKKNHYERLILSPCYMYHRYLNLDSHKRFCTRDFSCWAYISDYGESKKHYLSSCRNRSAPTFYSTFVKCIV